MSEKVNALVVYIHKEHYRRGPATFRKVGGRWLMYPIVPSRIQVGLSAAAVPGLRSVGLIDATPTQTAEITAAGFPVRDKETD